MTINLFLKYLLMPVVILAGGLLMNSDLAMNGLVGYKTKRSLSSPEMWAYAQKLCGRLWIRLGSLYIIAALAMVYLTSYRPSEAEFAMYIIPVFVASFVFVELQLKAKEEERNNESNNE